MKNNTITRDAERPELDMEHQRAAKQLMEEMLARFNLGETTEEMIAAHREWVVYFRERERSIILSKPPTEAEFARHISHFNLTLQMNDFLLALCEFQLDCTDLDDNQRKLISEEVKILRAQHIVFTHEINDWNPKMKKDELEAAVIKCFRNYPVRKC